MADISIPKEATGEETLPYSSVESLAQELEPPSLEETKGGHTVSRFARNSASNAVRIGITALVAILLPPYLTHHLPVRVYGAWVLILQLGAYVGYLNLGVQAALAKFIAEYESKRDLKGCERCASVGLLIMLGAGGVGVLLSAWLAWRIPVIFREMPTDLLHDVRVSVLIIGISLSVGLVSSVFSAIFLGLQRYHIPTVLGVASRLIYGLVLYLAVSLHTSLITMALAAAAVNLLTAAAEYLAWKKLASHIRVQLRSVDAKMLRQMLAYCAILTIWSACMLFISGLDLTIVGHYAFGQVGFYSIANSPTNMILLLIGALMGPLLPAVSAMSVSRDPEHMGQVLLRTTRYSTVVLLVTGLPVMVGGYFMLRLWVGPVYAAQSIGFLHLLLLANIIRNLCAPYSTMVIATSRQRVGTAAAITEAVVNLSLSIAFAQRFGAAGVALGTVIGAAAGVAMHFAVTMHYTQGNFTISRWRLFTGGILRPCAAALPSLLLVRYWFGNNPLAFSPLLWGLWLVSTALLTWFVSLSAPDRALLTRLLGSRLGRGPAAA